MLQHMFSNFLMYHKYFEGRVDSYRQLNGRELEVILTDGTTLIYDDLEQTCRQTYKKDGTATDEQLTREFAHRLRIRLKEKNMTQEDLEYETGIPQGVVSKYVTGKTMPSFTRVLRIARALDCPIEYFNCL